jgi:hypothetical protein
MRTLRRRTPVFAKKIDFYARRGKCQKGGNPLTGRIMRSMIPSGFFAGQSPLSCI